MIGLLGGALGAAGSIGAAMIGADAQETASANNYMIALLNYYQRQREIFDAKVEAGRQERKADLGFTDARGNRTHFVPGVGWKVDLSDASKGLQTREDAERMQQLGPDAQLRRQKLNQNAKRTVHEGDYADALFDQIRQQTRTNPDALERTLYGAATTGINRGFDDSQAQISKQALRSRSSNAGEILKSLARERGSALGDAASSARLKAIETAPQIDAANNKRNSDLYNLFATRASAMPDVTFQPSNVADSASGNLGSVSALGAKAGAQQFEAASMVGPRFPYQPPNFGAANTVGAIGSSLGGMFNQYQNAQGYNQLLEEIRRSTRGNQGEAFAN